MMKKKLVGGFICTILIMTSLSMATSIEENTMPDMVETDVEILIFEGDEQTITIDQCKEPDNGIGTIDIPASCPYEAVDDPFILTNGLPPGTTIELDPTLDSYSSVTMVTGGVHGGHIINHDAILTLEVTGTGSLLGFSRTLNVPVSLEVHIGPRTLGAPVQEFPGEVMECTGVLYGDPDFCSFQLTAGTNFGLPSPGNYVVTEIPGGLYNVDSFFDITYQIDFAGCPGSIIEGYAGSTIGTLRMQQGISIGNNPPDTPSMPYGPTSVVEYEIYTYTMSTTDPDLDPIRYGLDFNNDGIINPDHWTGYFSSGETCSLNIWFSGTGTRYLRVLAQDVHGALSGFSPALVITVEGGNEPPNTPGTPSGPTSGTIDESYTFSTVTTDPEGDTVRFGWDWDGDETVDEWSGFVSSGSSDTRSHSWSAVGSYNVQVMAEDDQGGQSAFSPAKTIVITENTPPNKPNTPTGPSSGKPGTSYLYSGSTMDPDGDMVYYQWDFGDEVSPWDGPYTSGTSVSMSHIWDSQGTYTVKVKAKDEHGAESTWSNPLSVTMPKTKDVSGTNVFGLCYIENSQPGEYTPARKHIYMGGITVLVCGEDSHTSVYNRRGGTELASFDGPQIVMIMLMLGRHQQTETERVYWGHAMGVMVFGR